MSSPGPPPLLKHTPANPRIMFHGCGGDALSTGYGALHHEWVEVGPSRLQGSGEARRARIEDTHRALVGLRVVAIITDSTMATTRRPTSARWVSSMPALRASPPP